MTELITDRILSPWLYIKWVYKFSDNKKRQKNALCELHGTSMKVSHGH